MYKHRLPRLLIFAIGILLSGRGQFVLALPAVPTDACALPEKPAGSPEETAWQIFVAINCKVANQQLTWETWKTQACLNNPADCNVRRLHGSVLRSANIKESTPDQPRRTAGCSAMTTKGTKDPLLAPFVPGNLSDNPQFCEEVTINASEEAYATRKGLLTNAGQMTFLQSGGTISFPTGAVEVKADWVAASSYNGSVTFDCKSPNTTTIYQEKIGDICYALTGMHISSKLYPKWLWATFEPQNKATNPNRCNPDLYNVCYDPWGSVPAKSKGKKTKISLELAALFDKAGTALDPSFRNYRLVGTQTAFDQPAVSHANLGNSFVEFNAGVKPGQASCITCHNYAQRAISGAAAGSTPGGLPPDGSAAVDNPTPLPTTYKSLDFSWLLGLGVPSQ